MGKDLNPINTIGNAAKNAADTVASNIVPIAGQIGENAVSVAGTVTDKAGKTAKNIADGASAAKDSAKNAVKNINNPIDLSEVDAATYLDAIYAKVINGIPNVSRTIDEMVEDYSNPNKTPEAIAWDMCRVQIAKCGASGFITGLGGAITLPVTMAAIPANITSVLYVQMRMAACVAKIGGYDIESDQVQTMVYMCMLGSSISDIAKETGIVIGEKTLTAAIKKIPGTALTAINKKVGFRLLTKFGEKGAINLGKLVPVAGGLIGGAFDATTTTVIAKNAIKMFINDENPTVEEISFEEVEEIIETEIPESEFVEFEVVEE